MKRAWRVECSRLGPEFTCVVPATTRATAVALTLRSAHEAGFDDIRFIDLRAKRDRAFDAWAKTAQSRCFSIEYIQREIAAARAGARKPK